MEAAAALVVVDALAVDVPDAVVVVAEPEEDADGLGHGDLGVEERGGRLAGAQELREVHDPYVTGGVDGLPGACRALGGDGFAEIDLALLGRELRVEEGVAGVGERPADPPTGDEAGAVGEVAADAELA